MNTSSETAPTWVAYCRSLLTLFGADSLADVGANGNGTAACSSSRVFSWTSRTPAAHLEVSIVSGDGRLT